MKTNESKPNGTSTFNVRCWMFGVSLRTPSIVHPRFFILLRRFQLSIFCFLLSLVGASAATRYVWQSSPSPAPPFATWVTAATNIQDAVDVALAGDEIVVTNGSYSVGGRDGSRVSVDKPLTVRSVNGPQFTIIEGQPGTTNYDGAIRCVSLTDGASLCGFTLTNGAAESGGGVCCASSLATVSNCAVIGNSASWGGGANGGTLNNCTLTGNSADEGGGAWAGTLNNCTLTGNWASTGGGVAYGTLNNCTLTGNSASGLGGGAFEGDWFDTVRLNNCVLTRNSARYGGGVYRGMLNNCAVTDNSATEDGGGAYMSAMKNCIVHFNTAANGANYYQTQWGGWLDFCCTTPMPANGIGNITNEPQFVDAAAGNYRLRPGSPCIDAGTNLSAILTNDLDGRPRPVDGNGDGLAAFDIGAYEYRALLVWQGSPSPAPPFATWVTAATNIQDAVDAALTGDEIVVTNGVYATGGRAVYGTMTNRVAVDKPLTVRSVNGPEFTIIQGYQLPGTTNGDGAIRCVYLANSASLSGFTLTDGATRSAGDWREQGGGGLWCESTNAMVSDCVVARNAASYEAGGVYGGTLNNCTISGNSAAGSYGRGGGAAKATLNNCTLTGNSASSGGGAWNGTLNNCTLTGNSAYSGGGAYGDFFEVRLNNCTLAGNSASSGGGVAVGDFGAAYLNNCIIYFNTATKGANNYSGGTDSSLNYCCTTPQPEPRWGIGNITLDPQLASASHLSAGSPCRGAGSPAYATGTDIDGEAWGTPPSIGCDEYHAGAITGPLSVSIVAGLTNVTVDFPVGLTALIEGRATANVWNFGDGMVVSNQPFATHAWAAPGDYTVTAWAYNESNPSGVSATATVHVVAQPVHFVAAGSTNPLAPYTSRATAATNIQDAVDAATVPGALVLVSNGVYATGGRALSDTETNRVAVDKPLTLRSLNGPQFTLIEGWPGTTNFDDAVRCVYLTNGASLSGFTLTNGGAWIGGGVLCESEAAVVSNCVVAGNSAAEEGGGVLNGTLNNCTLIGNSANWGGGAYHATLNNCTLTGNWAQGDRGYGGGAFYSTLNNCTLTGNSADLGGGALGTLNNCIVYFNTARVGANYGDSTWETLNYCCTTPLPTGGFGNITNAPLFVDYAAGNLRLQSNSPCINAGLNASAPGPTDLDGLPRIVRGTVDIGAYEFQGPGSVISYAWLQHYGLPTDGSADATDPDADGHTTWQEWRCLTDPTNALSVLQMTSAIPTSNPAGLVVTWQSVNTRTYYVQRNTNLGAQPAFTTIQSNIVGQAGTTSYTDTTATNAGPYFYRVGVQQ